MKKFGIITVLVVFVFTACNKTELDLPELTDTSIEGTYIGTLSGSSRLKSASDTADGDHGATAEVTKTGDGKIEVHCFGSELDTTFMLNYFENHDSIMVCLDGEDFNNMYGHMTGGGHMSGGMMGSQSGRGTNWLNHMDQEHQTGEEHFGGFDLKNRSFGYNFKMESGDLYFRGVKN